MKYIIPKIPFYFIRHGETDWNLKKMLQGQVDIPLNETGIKQAQEAVPFLVDKGITRIVTSPLFRAHKTAAIISEGLQVPLHTHEGLKERSWGKLEGTVKTKSALVNIDINYTQTADDSEAVDSFKGRINCTLHEVLLSDHTTLIVAHGGVYWALMNMLGFGHRASKNAIPYFFCPKSFDSVEKKNKLEWSVRSIKETKTVIG